MTETLLEEFLNSADPERTAWDQIAALVAAKRRATRMGAPKNNWKPGEKLRLLLVAYSGAGNIGADLRVSEMVRQFRTIFGAGALDLSLLSPDTAVSADLFPDVRVETISDYFPTFLLARERENHGLIACEGSMFKSTFSAALTAMLAGSLGLAAASGKPSIAYGAEAGSMEPYQNELVAEICRDALVICRNAASQAVLAPLGLRTRPGTDPAWTFDAAPRHRADAILRAAGWDGEAPVLVVCPVNPFWWPIYADFAKAEALAQRGEYRDIHCGSVFFHAHSEDRVRRYGRYLDELAKAIATFARESGAFVAVAGMDRLDRAACADLARRLPMPVRPLLSGDVDARGMVAVLRAARWLVSSRFHALVTAMPAGIASIGVSMDERIVNLLGGENHSRLLRVDDPDLAENLLNRLRRLDSERDRIAEESGWTVVRELRRLGEMGIDLVDEVCRCMPDYPRPNLPRRWDLHLPPLPDVVGSLLERYGAS
jgi:polysaccharide pyruvyl transferase WcaK-like protein